MRWYKKIALWLTGFIIVIIIATIGLNYWLNNNLPQHILEKNKTPYSIIYKKLEISLWNSSIKASDIVISPKSAALKNNSKLGIYAEIKSVFVKNFNVWDILFDNKIKAQSIIIKSPQVVLYKNNEEEDKIPKDTKSEDANPLQKIIVVSNIALTDGNFKIINNITNKPILSTKNIDFKIDGIVTDDDILKNKIPFLYNNYSLRCDSIYYNVSPFYTLTANHINTTKFEFKIKEIALIPKYSRTQFVQKIDKEKDLFKLKIASLLCLKMKWGFKQNNFYFNADSIIIDKLSANIFRNKIPADESKRKSLYNKLLREIPFKLNISTLQIKNSELVYEEQINFSKSPGMLTFNDFNLIATNIQSGFNQKSTKDVQIKVNCQFMNTSPLKAGWSFNVLDKNDGFKIKGTILNFNTKNVTQFLKPNTNVVTAGIIKKVHFDFFGNDNAARGTFGLNYKDLKVTVFKKKKPKEVSKIKSAIANLFIKNDSDNQMKYQEVTVSRLQEKSFFNFFWRCIAEGLLKSVL